MHRTFYLARVAAAAALLCALALPAAADGLSRFEAAIKKAQDSGDMPKGALTYKSAKPLGDTGFVLDDVVFTPPPDKTQGAKAEPIPIKHVTVEEFDFDSLDKKTPPTFLKMRAEGIAINSKPAEGVDLGQLAGIDKLAADFQVDYRIDREHKTLTLNRLELDLDGLARLEFSMVLDGVDPDKLSQPNANLNDATLRTASLVFDDQSLLGKGLPAAAKAQGMDADTLIKLGKAMIDGMRKDAAPPTLAVFDAVESYMDDYKHPKGPLRLTFNPPAKTSAATFTNMKNANDAVTALGLVVSYAGTRPEGSPGAAASAAPASGAPAQSVANAATATPATSKGGCTAGARFFVMHEDAYWSVTVREATASGAECVAKLDGGDEDVTFTMDKTLAWSLDGPGKPVAQCQSGMKVIAQNDDGAWAAAQVTDKPFPEGKCSIKFEGDDDDTSVELKRVRQLD